MPLPINIDELIHGQTVEWERIEFKKGWNDLEIIQTICAYANDFGNQGGGYLLIGIAEEAGKPLLPPKGLSSSEVDKIQKDLLSLCKQRISPSYNPIVEPVIFQGKLILIIWAPGGQERPYEAPEAMVKGAKRNYYIRKFSSTVAANKTEREELLRFSAVPFDDRVNHQRQIHDLSPTLVKGFLLEVKSKLIDAFDEQPFLSICRQMNVVEGPAEYVRPKNFGLMFFNEHPERIFPKAQIEIVRFKESAADKDFEEVIFEGPLHMQLRDALRYFRGQVMVEKVQKVSGQAEAIRSFNYPYEALEEVLANAVYHRDYEITEPIEIRIHPDKIHVISFPGPDPSIKMEDLQAGKVLVRRYRNRQIGNMLKELKLTEGKCTGIPTILKAMRNNGSSEPVFETDEARSYLLVTLPAHPASRTGRLDEVNLSSAEVKILQQCENNALNVREIAEHLGTKATTGGFRRALSKLLKLGLIAYTIPAKPNSRLQKYRITPSGYEYITLIGNKNEI